MRAGAVVSALLLLACPPACRPRVVERSHRSDAGARSISPTRFTVNWSPATGKGDVIERFPSGDLLRTCFHCTYPGYTGGLVIGNMNGSGMGLYPVRPLRGFPSINVFCAQDESIWDLDEKAEYSYGWSENIGTGADGKRLEYVGGRILEHDDQHVVLASENAGGCYRVFKVALTRADWRFWVIATRIQNRCDHPVRFDLWTGDDPWIGLYASSEGDVGWTPAGLVNHETMFGLGQFTAGGFYDLGNRALGEEEGKFSNQANFFALDPALPLPDFAGFANRFAHGEDEIDHKKPLDNKTMTALNLGWRKQTLAPGEFMEISLALGLAETGETGDIPRLPAMGDAPWSSWRRFLKTNTPSGQPLFASELVELHLDEGQLDVDAVYHLRNPSPDAQTVTIAYPILISRDSLAPTSVLVDGRPLPVSEGVPGQVSVRFPVMLAPHGLQSFAIRYQQRLLGRSASYMVTSARRWERPLDRAVFVIHHPASWRKVDVSYPVRNRETKNGRTTLTVVEQPFLPDHEVTVRWAPPARGK
jgi:hypothetical protein